MDNQTIPQGKKLLLPVFTSLPRDNFELPEDIIVVSDESFSLSDRIKTFPG